MSIKIDLSNHSNIFTTHSHEFSNKINFVFGRNGTGKTTITEEIERQLSDRYDVCVFKDFEGVAENERLDAISLGTQNAKIQKEISIIDKEIKEIKKLTEQPEDKRISNLYTDASKAKSASDRAEVNLESFYSDAAKKIRTQANPQISKTSYNKKDFRNEISKATSLKEEEVFAHKSTIKADEKIDVIPISFPNINLLRFLEVTNEVLSSSIPQSQDILELKNSGEKQSFARHGMDIHKNIPGEICAFCGSEISSERWRLLSNYFNEEVKKLETRITDGIEKITKTIDDIKNIKELNKQNFYEKFSKDVQELNLLIKLRQAEYKDFFEQLKTSLVRKRSNPFIESEALDLPVPENFDAIQQMFNNVMSGHNDLSKRLGIEQNKAKDALRYHEISAALNAPQYNTLTSNCTASKSAFDNAKKLLNTKKVELADKEAERKDLIMQTENEEKIAENINKLLTHTGVTSFSLQLVKSDEENQKGQYQIKGRDEKIRSVTQLSKGEKNIIAFLYFIFSLERADRKNLPKIIMFDDPMTSNDDTMQYLIITEIQRLYRNLDKDSYIFILTHNHHFYLNVRPPADNRYKVKEGEEEKEISFYEKYGTYNLIAVGNQTSIVKLLKRKQDFSTSYDVLWKALVFVYNSDEASADLMLNSCRRICETFLKFTKSNVNKFYKDNQIAKKLFDVNSHSIDDYEAEQNGRTKDEIKTIMAKLFKDNGAEDHFNIHWKGGAI